ncbi:MazG-like family protein [Methylophaga sp. UBA1464]|uniref:MazG-like family protein n=1 Tax=Methylophaga sp. UBA1464 TaxID=1946866 RepID=UPI0025F7938B|nr:MazG-like family protein [Methylophaga sp. UBA1464]
MADVAVYLSYLCHDLNINLEQAIQRKMLKNANKYPVDKVKGRADKYNEYS